MKPPQGPHGTGSRNCYNRKHQSYFDMRTSTEAVVEAPLSASLVRVLPGVAEPRPLNWARWPSSRSRVISSGGRCHHLRGYARRRLESFLFWESRPRVRHHRQWLLSAGSREKATMLQKVSDHIVTCLARAAEAERRATEASDEAMRIDNERMAKTWRHLASSFQFGESLNRFLLDADGRKRRLPRLSRGSRNLRARARPGMAVACK